MEPILALNFLDLQLVSDPLAVYNVSVGSPFSTSDHCVITWNTTWFPLMQSNLSFMSHDFKRADFKIMILQFLGSIDWVNLFISVPPNDALSSKFCIGILQLPLSGVDKPISNDFLANLLITFYFNKIINVLVIVIFVEKLIKVIRKTIVTLSQFMSLYLYN